MNRPSGDGPYFLAALKAAAADDAGYLVKVYSSKMVAQVSPSNEWLQFLPAYNITMWGYEPDATNLQAILNRVNAELGSSYTTIETEPSEYQPGGWSGPEIRVI